MNDNDHFTVSLLKGIQLVNGPLWVGNAPRLMLQSGNQCIVCWSKCSLAWLSSGCRPPPGQNWIRQRESDVQLFSSSLFMGKKWGRKLLFPDGSQETRRWRLLCNHTFFQPPTYSSRFKTNSEPSFIWFINRTKWSRGLGEAKVRMSAAPQLGPILHRIFMGRGRRAMDEYLCPFCLPSLSSDR